MALVNVGLLGPLTIRVGERIFGSADFDGPMPKRALEVLLVRCGQPVAKEQIIDALWAEQLPQNPRAALENYISGLRRTLSPDRAFGRRLIVTEPGARAYDRCRAALADTIGAGPLPETESLYLRVLNHDPVTVLLPQASPTARHRQVKPPTDTRYAPAGDVQIAYQVVGAGSPDLVFMPGSFSHVEVGWEERRYIRNGSPDSCCTQRSAGC